METIRLKLVDYNGGTINEMNDDKVYNEDKPYYSRVKWGMEWLNKHMDLNDQIPFRTVYKPDITIPFQFTSNRPLSIVTLDVPKELVLLLYEDIFNEFVCNNDVFLGDINVTGEGVNYKKDDIIYSWERAIYDIYDRRKKFQPILKNNTIIGMIPYFCTNWINKIVYFPDKKDDSLLYYLEELEHDE
jgi:hypothetical protein